MAPKINQNGTKSNSSASAKLYKDRGSQTGGRDLFRVAKYFFLGLQIHQDCVFTLDSM